MKKYNYFLWILSCFTMIFLSITITTMTAGSKNEAQKVSSKEFDDATIFAIFDQANTADIVTARIGANKGHTPEVRALGRMVASDHQAVQQMGRDLAKKLEIFPTPPQNDISLEKLADIVSLLQSKEGTEFDKAYLLYEIEFHDSVIKAINETLLPSIKNDEFKALVIKVLPGFERHLSSTIKVAEKLGYKKQ